MEKSRMMPFSKIEHDFQRLVDENDFSALVQMVKAFPESELTPAKTEKRIRKAVDDFWYFDSQYFTSDMYGDGYFEPSRFHRDIIKIMEEPGFHIVFGPRDHGKTVTGKKKLIHDLLTGKVVVAGTYAETLLKSKSILNDLFTIISENQRILHDFKPAFVKANEDQFKFRTNCRYLIYNSYRTLAAFSEDRSVRGFSKLFVRPKKLLGDDIETTKSSFTQQAIEARIKTLGESYRSLSNDANFTIFANDFDERSALHRIRIDFENGFLKGGWKVHVFQAWTKKNAPLWENRYPALNESEMRVMVKAVDESDWQGNFQQNPIPPDGFYFKRDYYTEYVNLPKDAKGVLFCDPNLSKKGKGDTTAATALLYSPSLDSYVVAEAVCKSFADSNLLLDEILNIKHRFMNEIRSIGFDGNVSQESTWTNNVRNYCRIKQIPFPPVYYKRYHVDDLAKNLQKVYVEGRLKFPQGFAKSKHGIKFLEQFFAFTGKKSNRLDDAPDSIISAFELIHEKRLNSRNTQSSVSVKDYYSVF